jgi:alpha-L-rhamnosidase
MYATISAWFYRYLAGIQPLAPGFDRFLVRPFMPRGLDEVSARLCTVKGEIRAGWTRNGSGATVRIDVPFGSVCDAQLPVPQGLKSVRVNEQSVSSGAAVGGRVHIPLKSGTYEIVLSW